jgi:tripartite-type tricarboxylate transporter receptor subunit TctC
LTPVIILNSSPATLQVQVLFGVMPASLGYIRAGKLRALAVTRLLRIARTR